MTTAAKLLLAAMLGVIGLYALAAMLALLSGCAVTPEAAAKRSISGMLRSCYRSSHGWPAYVSACEEGAATRCALAELPDDCWRDALVDDCLSKGTVCFPSPPDGRLQL